MTSEKQKSELLRAASDVASQAYAPYSKVKRGAAVLTSTGEIFSGCNVELASYGGTICAEMSALSAAIAANHRKFTAIALSPPDYPCGICRQMLVEFGIEVDVITEAQGSPTVIPLKELLPFHFGPHNLA